MAASGRSAIGRHLLLARGLQSQEFLGISSCSPGKPSNFVHLLTEKTNERGTHRAARLDHDEQRGIPPAPTVDVGPPQRSRQSVGHNSHRGLWGWPLSRRHRGGLRRRRQPLCRRDHFAPYNGTALVEVPSGGHKVFRLSRWGKRRLNHALHMAAVTQVSHRHREGRPLVPAQASRCKFHKTPLRCLKARTSNAIFAGVVADAKRNADAANAGPGGQRGNGSVSSVASSHPERQLFGQATPRPATPKRPRPIRLRPKAPVQGQNKLRKAS